jgi:DNA invertase Pin-like site-specific DNA recombinase
METSLARDQTSDEAWSFFHAFLLPVRAPAGKLTPDALGSVARFEREMSLERQREGIAKAKAEGRYRDGKPTVLQKSEEVLAFLESRVTNRKAADKSCISERSVCRIAAHKGRPHHAGRGAPCLQATM